MSSAAVTTIFSSLQHLFPSNIFTLFPSNLLLYFPAILAIFWPSNGFILFPNNNLTYCCYVLWYFSMPWCKTIQYLFSLLSLATLSINLISCESQIILLSWEQRKGKERDGGRGGDRQTMVTWASCVLTASTYNIRMQVSSTDSGMHGSLSQSYTPQQLVKPCITDTRDFSRQERWQRMAGCFTS